MPTFGPLPERDPRLFSPPPTTTPVLIVGSGPAGLFAAYLFAKRAIKSVILEKYPLRLGQPKAHALNPRSLEIFRQVGLNVPHLCSLSSTADEAFWVRFVAGLSGHELARLPYERQDAEVRSLSPEPLRNVAQPVLESFLQEAVLEAGYTTIHRGWKWEAVSFDINGDPISVLQHRDSDEKSTIVSTFVLGADGTESDVRKNMGGVEWAYPGGVAIDKKFYRSIHVRGDVDRMRTRSGGSAELFFCVHPAHQAGLIMHHSDGSWVHASGVNPVEDLPENMTQARCHDLVRACVGPDIQFEVMSVNVWYTWPHIASQYHCKNARLFLLGDAAHSFPPQGGLGVNTGFADAHNLVWKLATSIQQKQSSLGRLAESYTLERKPVATVNALQSAMNEELWIKFSRMSVDMVRQSFQYEEGSEAYFEQPAVKQEIERSVRRYVKAHFDSLGLQLGYVYNGEDGTTLPAECWVYEPSAVQGARLPHVWLDKAQTLSILDRVPTDRFAVLHAGHDFTAREYSVAEWVVHVDSIDVRELGDGSIVEWQKLTGVNGRSALLVRPDQHILADVETTTDIEAALTRYFGSG